MIGMLLMNAWRAASSSLRTISARRDSASLYALRSASLVRWRGAVEAGMPRYTPALGEGSCTVLIPILQSMPRMVLHALAGL